MKSSFCLFQILLLIKDTLRLASTAIPLSNDGDYPVREIQKLIFGQIPENKIGISFDIPFADLGESTMYADFGIPRSSSTSGKCLLDIEFGFDTTGPVISTFRLLLNDPNLSEPSRPLLNIVRQDNSYWGEATAGFTLGFAGFVGEPVEMEEVRFEAVFPLSYKKGDDVRNFNLTFLKTYLTSYFARISYIGPIRREPEEYFVIDGDHRNVGTHGEFAAQILQSQGEDIIQYYRLRHDSNGFGYEEVEEELVKAVKYWICDEFGIAKDIFAQRNGDAYQIILENELGLKTTIEQVGFGVSQVLPIVIEGMRMPDNGILLLEEPESHLHPKLQAVLFDFFYSLVRRGITIVMETHSDHFINRMRRRVAEDGSNDVVKAVNLSFISSKMGEADFELITLDEFGITEFFPEDFIELTNNELSALMQAQIQKRRAVSKDE